MTMWETRSWAAQHHVRARVGRSGPPGTDTWHLTITRGQRRIRLPLRCATADHIHEAHAWNAAWELIQRSPRLHEAFLHQGEQATLWEAAA